MCGKHDRGAQAGSSSNAALAIALVVVLSLDAFAMFAAKGLGFGWVDDAYITYRYAENLAQGHGLVFNPGQRVEGFSNPLWTLQLAGVARLGGKLEDWAVALQMLANIVCVLVVCMMVARRLCPRFGAMGAGATGVIMALSPPLLFYGVCGLETAQHTMLVTMALMMTSLSPSTRGVGLGIACTALATVSRPEGIILVPVVGVVLALRCDWSRRRRIATLVGLVLATVTVFGTYVGWRHTYYGQWLPNTFYAKVDVPSLTILVRGIGSTVEFALGSLLLLWMPLWFWVRQKWMRSWTAAVVLGFAVHFMFTCLVGGDFMPLNRFFVPVWPVMVAALVQAVCTVATRLSRRSKPFLLTASALLAITSGLIFYGGEYRNRLPGSDLVEYRAIGDWLASQARPGESMAGSAMGVVPYVSKLVAHDFLGLTEPEIARHGSLWSQAPPGHRRQGAQHIFALKPSYLIIWTKTFTYPITEEEFITRRYNFPAFVELLRMRTFAGEYRYAVVDVTPPLVKSPAYLALYARRGRYLVNEVTPIGIKNLIRRFR